MSKAAAIAKIVAANKALAGTVGCQSITMGTISPTRAMVMMFGKFHTPLSGGASNCI